MNPLQNYQNISIKTSTPLENIILLYERCIFNIIEFKKSIEKKDMSNKGKFLKKAMDILIALDSGLDFSQGEIAKNLHTVYECIMAQLSKANINNEIEPVDYVNKWLNDILNTWKEIKEKGLHEKN